MTRLPSVPLSEEAQEDARDLVLEAVNATEEGSPLATAEICARTGLGPSQARAALRDLAAQGEVRRLETDVWAPARVVPTPATRPAQVSARDFTDDELRRARERHGTTSTCPHCGIHGNIDQAFGWRRMRPDDTDLVPQSWCMTCRRG